MTYQLVLMLCVPIQFYTGILMWDVKRFSAQVNFFGGVRVIDTVHVLIFIVIVFYLFVHVYLSTLGHTRTAHFKAMFTGYDGSKRTKGSPPRRRRNPRRPPTPARPDPIAPAPPRRRRRPAEQPLTTRL